MTKLFVLCGYPFAGKSTIARELVERFNLVRIALDDIFAEQNIDTSTNTKITSEQQQIVYDIYQNRIAENLDLGNSAIIDSVAHKREARDSLRQLAEKHRAQMSLLFVDTPLDVATQRWQQNRGTQARVDVQNDSFNEVVQSFEKPTPDENPIVITPNAKLDEVIRRLQG